MDGDFGWTEAVPVVVIFPFLLALDGQFLWRMAVGNGGTLDVCLVARDWVFFDAVFNVAAVVFFGKHAKIIAPLSFCCCLLALYLTTIGEQLQCYLFRPHSIGIITIIPLFSTTKIYCLSELMNDIIRATKTLAVVVAHKEYVMCCCSG